MWFTVSRPALPLAILLALASCGEAPLAEGDRASLAPGIPLIRLLIEREGAEPLLVQGPNPTKLPSDLEADGVRAWRARTLFGGRLDHHGAVLEAVRVDGSYEVFAASGAAEPVLAVNGEGHWSVGRPAEDGSLPHPAGPSPVSELRLRLPVKRPTAGKGVLEVDLSGSRSELRMEDLPTDSRRGGEWALRAVVAHLGGDRARLASIETSDGRTIQVSVEQWSNADLVPLLKKNRRGLWKVRWDTAEGSGPAPGDAPDVVLLRLVVP